MPKIYNQKYLLDYQRKLRQEMTKSEVILWSKLKGKQLGYKFRRQYGVGKYIVDFFCPEVRVCIEIDGSTHNEESVFQKDLEKEKCLKDLGLIVKRYNSGEIFNNLVNVLEDIYQSCLLVKNKTSP